MAPWIDVAGWTLVHFVWQGAVIGGGAAVGFWLLQNATSEARYTMASAALILMLLSPVVTAGLLSSPSASVMSAPSATSPVFLPLVTPNGPLNGGTGKPLPGAVSVRPRLVQVLPAIVVMWLIGVAVLLARLGGGWWRVRTLQRAARTAPSSPWQVAADRLGRQLGLRCRVHVTESDAVDTPAAIGWWRPVIILPLAALSGLTPAQIDAILTHELAHIRRHDYVVNVLQHVTETVLFYHPAVWWVSSRMRIEREQCCDAVVVDICGDPLDYAAALTHLEEARSTDAVFAIAATGGRLVKRIRRLLGQPSHPHRPVAHALITTGIVTALVLILGGGYRRSIRTLQASGRSAQQEQPEVATVNGEPVTQVDLDHFRPLHGEAAATPLPRVLVDLIDERLVGQRGRQLGITVKDGELQDAVAYLKRQNKVQTDAELEAQLAKQHLTMADLRRHLERAIIGFHVRDGEAFDRTVVTDEEARRYFDVHLGDFPLQTFESVRADLVMRLRRDKLGSTLPESYLQSLRVATVVWARTEIKRAYEEGLTQRVPPQGRADGTALGRTGADSSFQLDSAEPVTTLNAGDFCCPDYLGKMIQRVRSSWLQGRTPGMLRCASSGEACRGVVRFTIERDGTISKSMVEKPTSSQALNAHALTAVRRVQKLPPLPAAFPKRALTVHLQFAASSELATPLEFETPLKAVTFSSGRETVTVLAVNGEHLTSNEFAHLVQGAKEARAGALDDSLNADAVVDAVDQVLAAQQGHLLGYAMTDEQFDSVLQNLRTSHGIESEGQLEAALVHEGLSRSDLRRNLERQMIFSLLRNNITRENVDIGALRSGSNIVWSDDSLRQLYERGLSRRP
jgi:TonB family protein